jgi:hypothetical protein
MILFKIYVTELYDPLSTEESCYPYYPNHPLRKQGPFRGEGYKHSREKIPLSKIKKYAKQVNYRRRDGKMMLLRKDISFYCERKAKDHFIYSLPLSKAFGVLRKALRPWTAMKYLDSARRRRALE